jgi:transposase InsO family protein
MTKDDVLFGYRLQLFDLAGRTTVCHACRTFGVHRSTYYRWKAQVDRQGLEHCFYVGRLHGTKGVVWQLTAIDTYSSFAWAELVRCDGPGPDQGQTSRFAQRVARTLRQAGWQIKRVITDNGNEFQTRFRAAIEALGARQTKIRAGRPQTNGHVERLHRTILEECWRPAFARFLYLRYRGLQRELDAYLDIYNHHRAHTGRITQGRCPAELVYGARKMEPR